MVGWIHFTFQTASLVSLFVIRPRREALDAIRHVEAFTSGYDPGNRGRWFLREPRGQKRETP
jgi:hypothetical protein